MYPIWSTVHGLEEREHVLKGFIITEPDSRSSLHVLSENFRKSKEVY